MNTRRFEAPLPLPWVNGCDSSSGISNAFTNTKPVSSHRAWYTDNLNICSTLIIPFTTSLYWIIHLHTSDWDQQQKGLVCGCTSLSLGWGLITSVSWVGTKHGLEVEWGLLSVWRCCIKTKWMLVGAEKCSWTVTYIIQVVYFTTITSRSILTSVLHFNCEYWHCNIRQVRKFLYQVGIKHSTAVPVIGNE